VDEHDGRPGPFIAQTQARLRHRQLQIGRGIAGQGRVRSVHLLVLNFVYRK